MKALATAIVDVLAFLELSDDAVIDADSAASKMESIAAHLAGASASERAAISAAVDAALSREITGPNRSDVISFYENFMASIGLE